MDHADHVRLIRDGVAGAGPRWLELGAGEGAFTLALADILGQRGVIVATDLDGAALARLSDRMTRWFPSTALDTRQLDFRETLPEGRFDGVLAANSLHFGTAPATVLARVRKRLGPGGRVVVVEYDADRGNAWVPQPFSADRFPAIVRDAGLVNPRLIGRVPSRFLGAIYAAVADVPEFPPVADPTAPLVHSPPHGDDREE